MQEQEKQEGKEEQVAEREPNRDCLLFWYAGAAWGDRWFVCSDGRKRRLWDPTVEIRDET